MTCYSEMLTSMQDGDSVAAREHALNLQHWLSRSGFCPQGYSLAEVKSQLARVLHCKQLRFCFPEKISLIRRAGDVSPLIAISAVRGDRRCLSRASTGATEKQNRKNRRLTSRGSPFSVTSNWVAGEAHAKSDHRLSTNETMTFEFDEPEEDESFNA